MYINRTRNIMSLLKRIFSDTLHLFYPHLCQGCGSDLLQKDHLLCLKCIYELPHTSYEKFPGNPIEKYFWGRLDITAAHSEFYFTKDSLIQHLVHQLKYKGNTGIGRFLGELMGENLLLSGRFSDINAIIPLPLYPDKEHHRGYNQAAVIGEGLSTIMNIPLDTTAVIRQRATETQTRKHRTERWLNVNKSFLVNDSGRLDGKHLLLVDDVITTGATLEACGRALIQQGNVKLSIATLAHAPK